MIASKNLAVVLSFSLLVIQALAQPLTAGNVDSSAGSSFNSNSSLQVVDVFEHLVRKSLQRIRLFEPTALPLMLTAIPQDTGQYLIRLDGQGVFEDNWIHTQNSLDFPDVFSTPEIEPGGIGRRFPLLRLWHLTDVQCTLRQVIDNLDEYGYSTQTLEVRMVYPTTDYLDHTRGNQFFYAFLWQREPELLWLVYGTKNKRFGIFEGDITRKKSTNPKDGDVKTNSTIQIADRR